MKQTQIRNLYFDPDSERFAWGLDGAPNGKALKLMWIHVEVTVTMDLSDISTMTFQLFDCVRFQSDNLSAAAIIARQICKDMVDPPLTNRYGRTFTV